MEIKEDRQHPWLLIPHETKQIFYNVSDNRFHTTNILELHNKYVFAAGFGWLVLADMYTTDCCLWNPVSLEKIVLPELFCSRAYNRCVLSKSPTEPDCHILFTTVGGQLRAFCQIGDDQFVEQFTCNGKEVRLFAVGAFCGKIYGIMDPDYQFVILNFVGGTLQVNPILMDGGQPWNMPCPSRSWATSISDCLIESLCGEFLLVHTMCTSHHLEEGVDFKVFRVDVNQKECVELKDIGNRAIFINKWGSVFCCSSRCVKTNSIYYTVPNIRNLYTYHLDDRSTTISLPCPIVGRPEQCYWIPPQIVANLLT